MRGDAGNYRTSSTPVLVCVSFSPRLARMQILPYGQFASVARGGAITTSPLRGWVGGGACGMFVVGFMVAMISSPGI